MSDALALRVAPDQRHIVDGDGNPFLIQGDAAWSLIVNTTLDEAAWFLDQRQAQGFNAVLINFIEHLFASDAPRNLAGDEPFTAPGDFSTPNEAYMAHADKVVQLTLERGIIAILYPTFLGFPNPHYPGYGGQNEGWYDEIVANGPDKCRAYGEYLGRRYGSFPNVVWSIGADRNPDGARAGLDAMAEGIRATSPGRLMTAQMLPEHSAAEHWEGAEWLDILSTYSYGIIPRLMERDWRSTPTRPCFLVESAYENEHNTTQLQLRRAAYWSVLSGGNGNVMGNKPIWMFGPGWKDEVASEGAQGLKVWGEFFRSIAWSTLVPDWEETLVSSGAGELRGLNQIGSAWSQDGRLAVVYTPERRPLTIETGTLAGPTVVATWVEPATGSRLPAGTLATGGPVVVTPPFPEDALLLLESGE